MAHDETAVPLEHQHRRFEEPFVRDQHPALRSECERGAAPEAAILRRLARLGGSAPLVHHGAIRREYPYPRGAGVPQRDHSVWRNGRTKSIAERLAFDQIVGLAQYFQRRRAAVIGLGEHGLEPVAVGVEEIAAGANRSHQEHAFGVGFARDGDIEIDRGEPTLFQFTLGTHGDQHRGMTADHHILTVEFEVAHLGVFTHAGEVLEKPLQGGILARRRLAPDPDHAERNRIELGLGHSRRDVLFARLGIAPGVEADRTTVQHRVPVRRDRYMERWHPPPDHLRIGLRKSGPSRDHGRCGECAEQLAQPPCPCAWRTQRARSDACRRRNCTFDRSHHDSLAGTRLRTS